MNIYFCGSICGGRDDAPLYYRIIEKLKYFGTVLTEHVGDATMKSEPYIGSVEEIHDRDMKWMTQADVVVAEVTQPSLGVGYEIGRAVTMNKRIIALFRPSSGRKLSSMIDGIPKSPNFRVIRYREEEVDNVVDDIFKEQDKTM